MARALIVTLVAMTMPVTAHAVSTWNPTLIVNTESFQQIDVGDGTTSVDLRFGASTSTLKLLSTGVFQFNKSLSVVGSISGSSLMIDHNANILEHLTVGSSNTHNSGAQLTVESRSITGPANTNTNATLLSIDQMGLGQLKGGAVFGRTGLTENQWSVENAGTVWMQKDASRNWQSIAMSSNGKYQTAVVSAGNIYVSTDYGNTWNARGSTQSWRSVAMSADGRVQTAVAASANIYVSTDYGTTWHAKGTVESWYTVAMSADGKIQTAGILNGRIYVSKDYGNNWVPVESQRVWAGNAMSSDGKIQTAVTAGGFIYVSTDYGSTWVQKGSSDAWQSVAMSSDGRFQTAGTVYGTLGLQTSDDYGQTWTTRDTNRDWVDIAMSGDGKIQTAIVYGGGLYVSTDYGVTWSPYDTTRNWYSVAMSSDGKVQTAVVSVGFIYVSYANSSTVGSVTVSGALTIRDAVGIQGPLAVTGAIRTDSNITINDDADSNDAILTFGNTSGNQTLKFLNSTQKFQFSKPLSVVGGISGSYLTIDRQANISGALVVKNTITAMSTVSGANLTFMGVTNSYILGNLGLGTNSPTAKLDVRGRINAGSGNLASIPGQFVLQDTAAVGNSLTITTNGNIGDSILGINFVDRINGAQQGAEGQNGAYIRSVRETTSARFGLQFGTASGALSGDATTKMTILSNGSVGIGTTAPKAMLDALGTISGARLSVSHNANISGSLLVKNSLSGSSFFGAGLGDCNNGTNSKLIYNSTTGKFSCATDQTGGGTGGSNWSNTGALQTAFDARYVNQSGDTMTGILRINKQGSAYTGALLNVLGGMSGYFLRTSGNADIHGALTASGSVRTDGDLTINDDRTTSADAVLTFGNSTANQTIKFVHSMQKFEFSASVRVVGTISGSALRVDGNADVNGTLSLSGVTLHRTVSDPSAPGSSRLATFASDLGGRALLKGKAAVGGAYAYQPGLFQSFIMMIEAGGGTTINGIGTTVTNDTTISHPTADEVFGYMANFATSTTNNDTAGSSSTNTTFIRGSTTGANGFFYRARIGVVDTTSIRVFSGLANQTIATMVGADNPTGHHVGFQFSTNRGDTNWMFTTKDGTTQNAVSTGIAFTANKVYDLTFYCSQQCTSISWRVDNVTDGTSATGTASTNLPGTSTPMRIVQAVSTLTTAVKNLRMQFAYTETDR